MRNPKRTLVPILLIFKRGTARDYIRIVELKSEPFTRGVEDQEHVALCMQRIPPATNSASPCRPSPFYARTRHAPIFYDWAGFKSMTVHRRGLIVRSLWPGSVTFSVVRA